MVPKKETTSDFQVIFYKKSSKTNLNNLKKNPRDLVRHSQDEDMITLIGGIMVDF